jgi:hypothetical protein
MTVSTDLIATWWRPREILRQHLARGRSESFALSFLLIFLLLAFVGLWPEAARDAYVHGERSAWPRILPLAYGVLAAIPFLYGLAALGHLAARVMGGQGTWYGARIALFWALATVGPLMLLRGLVSGMIGPGPALSAVTLAVGVGFLWQWVTLLHEAEQGGEVA